jgi:hypothetical protein
MILFSGNALGRSFNGGNNEARAFLSGCEYYYPRITTEFHNFQVFSLECGSVS